MKDPEHRISSWIRKQLSSLAQNAGGRIKYSHSGTWSSVAELRSRAGILEVVQLFCNCITFLKRVTSMRT